MSKTNIEWVQNTDGSSGKTWNPLSGCTRISAGCQRCYAEVMTKRLAAMGQTKYQGLLNEHGRFNGVMKFDEKALMLPCKTRKPTTWFVNSMSDLFHENAPDEWIDQIFAVMALTPHHTFQILTKRPERMCDYLGTGAGELFGRINDAAREATGSDSLAVLPTQRHGMVPSRWPLPNVHLGVSVENEETATERIPLLLDTPNALPWVSYEPALGPVNFSRYLFDTRRQLKWIVVGGESGPDARPLDVQWIRYVIAQGRAAGIPIFVKQMGSKIHDRNDVGFEGDEPGAWPMDTRTIALTSTGYQGESVQIKLKSKKGGDPSEWPEDLRVRQFLNIT